MSPDVKASAALWKFAAVGREEDVELAKITG